VLALGTTARESNSRIGPFLAQVAPLVIVSAKVDDDDELRECCLQAVDAFASVSHLYSSQVRFITSQIAHFCHTSVPFPFLAYGESRGCVGALRGCAGVVGARKAQRV
jgi:hypothetical protein